MTRPQPFGYGGALYSRSFDPRDADPLTVEPLDERVPFHPPTEPRRSGCNWGCAAALAGCAAFWGLVLLVMGWVL